jgi:YbgC/YbaW family acyl-CoA thioester hydrolase
MPQFRDNLPPGARTFESRVQVQWADCDIAGIIYFVNYWRYAEFAEMEMFAELGFPFAKMFYDSDLLMPRVRAEAEFFAPSLMGDWLRIRTHIDKVGASSIRWVCVVFNEMTGVANAALTLTAACVSSGTKKSIPIPDRLRAALLATRHEKE